MSASGLFHRLICQSGTICFPWAVDPDPLDTARRTARILGCNSDDPAVIVNFLEHISAKKLIKAQFKAAPFEVRQTTFDRPIRWVSFAIKFPFRIG